jgi:hypothetical protein
MKNTVAKSTVAKLDHSAAAAVFKVAVSNEEGAFHGYVPSETMEFLYSHLPLLAAEMIQKHLGLASPEFTLSVDKNNKKQLAHYKIGRDGLGLKERISLNVLHLASSKAQVISTVLHEMLHGVQHSSGKPGKGNYHNAEFIGWCETLGIPTNAKGHDLGINPTGLFADYAKRHALEGKFELAKKDPPKPKGSNLKKWTCSCGVNVRVAIDDFEATCNKCDTKFERKD